MNVNEISFLYNLNYGDMFVLKIPLLLQLDLLL